MTAKETKQAVESFKTSFLFTDKCNDWEAYAVLKALSDGVIKKHLKRLKPRIKQLVAEHGYQKTDVTDEMECESLGVVQLQNKVIRGKVALERVLDVFHNKNEAMKNAILNLTITLTKAQCVHLSAVLSAASQHAKETGNTQLSESVKAIRTAFPEFPQWEVNEKALEGLKAMGMISQTEFEACFDADVPSPSMVVKPSESIKQLCK